MFEKEKAAREDKKRPEEPTLLRVELEDYNIDGLVDWLQRYPYAAVLPVQPMMITLADKGVDVLFRRKPTKERTSVDGGLKVRVEETSVTWDPHRWPEASRTTQKGEEKTGDENVAFRDTVDAEGTGRKGGGDRYDPQRVSVVVTRIAEGQNVEKKFSEKLVVQRMLKDLKEDGFSHGRAVTWFANDLSNPAALD